MANNNPQFVAGITPFLGNLNLKTLIESALNLSWDEIAGSPEVNIYAFYLSTTTQILSLYLVADSKFSMIEISKSGDELLVTLPISRVMRTSLSKIGTNISFLIEIDADKKVYSKDTGDIRSSVYLINSPDADSIPLRNFATIFNNLLNF